MRFNDLITYDKIQFSVTAKTFENPINTISALPCRNQNFTAVQSLGYPARDNVDVNDIRGEYIQSSRSKAVIHAHIDVKIYTTNTLQN